MIKLNLRERITIFFFGRVHMIGFYYAAKCSRHGVYIDYPHGWKEELECPLCLEDRKKKKSKDPRLRMDKRGT